jgi:probable addiction module antidote protein
MWPTYLQTSLDEGEPGLIMAALGDIARARGMSDASRAARLGRESLMALSKDGGVSV